MRTIDDIKKALKLIVISALALFSIFFLVFFIVSGSLAYARDQLEEFMDPVLKIGIISSLTTLTGLIIAKIFTKINKERLRYKILHGLQNEINSARIRILMLEVTNHIHKLPIREEEAILTDDEYASLSAEFRAYILHYLQKNVYVSEADRRKQTQSIHTMVMKTVDGAMKKARKVKADRLKQERELAEQQKRESGRKLALLLDV